MERLTERLENGAINVKYASQHETAIHRLVTIEDILGDEYDLDELREMVQANIPRLIDEQSTISAVPVVRCRECAHYKICDEWESGNRMLCEIHHHSYLDHDGDNHFCSWGQRKIETVLPKSDEKDERGEKD